MRKRVLYVTNIPSPYRVDYFNELGVFCDLTVLFELESYKERDSSWGNYSFKSFSGRFMKGIKYGANSILSVDTIHYIKRESPDIIVITNYSSISGFLAVLYLIICNKEYWIEGDGAFSGEKRGIKALIKHFIFAHASHCFSTSKCHDEYYLMYGATKDKLIRYPFSSIYNDDVLVNPITLDEKLSIRKELGINEEKIVLSVGQFIYRKGFDILIKSAKDISNAIGVYIVGGTPTDEYIKMKDEMKLNNVHFVGFKSKEELSLYYKVADIFVLPTREDIWGLVINEALAYGLPIITTERCIAGTELVKNNFNGVLVPVGNDKILSNEINKLVWNDDLLNQYANNSLVLARQYTIEKMVEAHVQIWNKSVG